MGLNHAYLVSMGLALPAFAGAWPFVLADMDEVFRRIFQLLLLVFFFGGPLLKRERAASKQGRTARKPATARQQQRSELERKGQELWKQLLEGLDPEAAERRTRPTSKPPPSPPTRRAVPDKPPTPSFPPPTRTQVAEATFSEIDEDAVEANLVVTAPLSGMAPPSAAGTLAVAAASAVEEDEPQSGRSGSEWRRAIALAEVLSPPVGLRKQPWRDEAF